MGAESGGGNRSTDDNLLYIENATLRAQLAERSRECDHLMQSRQKLDKEVMELSASLFEVCIFLANAH